MGQHCHCKDVKIHPGLMSYVSAFLCPFVVNQGALVFVCLTACEQRSEETSNRSCVTVLATGQFSKPPHV